MNSGKESRVKMLSAILKNVVGSENMYNIVNKLSLEQKTVIFTQEDIDKGIAAIILKDKYDEFMTSEDYINIAIDSIKKFVLEFNININNIENITNKQIKPDVVREYDDAITALHNRIYTLYINLVNNNLSEDEKSSMIEEIKALSVLVHKDIMRKIP